MKEGKAKWRFKASGPNNTDQGGMRTASERCALRDKKQLHRQLGWLLLQKTLERSEHGLTVH